MARAVLALDLASTTGWALWQPGWPAPIWGEWELPQLYPGDDGTMGAGLWTRLDKLDADHDIAAAVFEATQMQKKSGRAFRVLNGLAFLAETWWRTTHGTGSHATELQTSTVDAHFGSTRGQGSNVRKTSVMRICAEMGWDVKGQHNAADALAVLSCQLALWGIQVPWNMTPLERAALGGKDGSTRAIGRSA